MKKSFLGKAFFLSILFLLYPLVVHTESAETDSEPIECLAGGKDQTADNINLGQKFYTKLKDKLIAVIDNLEYHRQYWLDKQGNLGWYWILRSPRQWGHDIAEDLKVRVDALEKNKNFYFGLLARLQKKYESSQKAEDTNAWLESLANFGMEVPCVKNISLVSGNKLTLKKSSSRANVEYLLGVLDYCNMRHDVGSHAIPSHVERNWHRYLGAAIAGAVLYSNRVAVRGVWVNNILEPLAGVVQAVDESMGYSLGEMFGLKKDDDVQEQNPPQEQNPAQKEDSEDDEDPDNHDADEDLDAAGHQVPGENMNRHDSKLLNAEKKIKGANRKTFRAVNRAVKFADEAFIDFDRGTQEISDGLADFDKVCIAFDVACKAFEVAQAGAVQVTADQAGPAPTAEEVARVQAEFERYVRARLQAAQESALQHARNMAGDEAGPAVRVAGQRGLGEPPHEMRCVNPLYLAGFSQQDFENIWRQLDQFLFVDAELFVAELCQLRGQKNDFVERMKAVNARLQEMSGHFKQSGEFFVKGTSGAAAQNDAGQENDGQAAGQNAGPNGADGAGVPGEGQGNNGQGADGQNAGGKPRRPAGLRGFSRNVNTAVDHMGESMEGFHDILDEGVAKVSHIYEQNKLTLAMTALLPVAVVALPAIWFGAKYIRKIVSPDCDYVPLCKALHRLHEIENKEYMVSGPHNELPDIIAGERIYCLDILTKAASRNSGYMPENVRELFENDVKKLCAPDSVIGAIVNKKDIIQRMWSIYPFLQLKIS